MEHFLQRSGVVHFMQDAPIAIYPSEQVVTQVSPSSTKYPGEQAKHFSELQDIQLESELQDKHLRDTVSR
jgi:hypothetical protein